MTKGPYNSVVIAGVLLLVALGGYWFWHGMVSDTTAEAAQLRSELQTRGEAGGRAALARRALQDLEAKEASVYGHFVGTNDIVPFLESIEATGEKLGTQIEVVSVGNVGGKPQAHVQVSLRIEGSFDAVLRTVGAVEYQAYDTTLQSLTLDTPGGSLWSAAAIYLVGAAPQVGTSTPNTP